MKVSDLLNEKVVMIGGSATIGFVLGGICGYILFTMKKEKELDKAIEECNRVSEEAVRMSETATEALDVAREKLSENNVKAAEGSDLALTKEEYEALYSGGVTENVKGSEEIVIKAMTDPAESESPSEDYDEVDDEEAAINDSISHSGRFAGDNGEVFDDESVSDAEIREANYYAAERRKPKFITEDVFEYDGRDIYDKADLYYYVYDDTLATEDEEIIDNEEHTVGNCLDKYGFRNSDEGEIYVRNFYTMTDYRITKMYASFSGEM